MCGIADAGSQTRLRGLLPPDATFTKALGMTETTSIITLFYPKLMIQKALEG